MQATHKFSSERFTSYVKHFLKGAIKNNQNVLSYRLSLSILFS